MIKRLRTYLTTVVYPYTDAFDLSSAHDLLRYLLGFIVVLGAILLLSLVGATRLTPDQSVITVLLMIALLGLMYLVQMGQVRAARNLLVIMIFMAVASFITEPLPTFTTIISLLLPLITAGILGTRRTIIIVAVLTLMLFTFIILSRPTIELIVTLQNRFTTLVGVGINIVVVTLLLLAFGESASRLARVFSAEVSILRRSLNTPELTTLDISELVLLKQTLDRFVSDYGFSLAQVVVLDSGGSTARLYYTGFGLDELQVGETIDIATSSPLTDALRTGEPEVIDSDSSSLRRRHLSVGMQTAVLIPITGSQGLMGVLDLQSKASTPITLTQTDGLQAYALRLGLALERTRVMAQLRADIDLQKDIISNLRKRVTDLQQEKRNTLDATNWQRYFDDIGGGTLGFDLQQNAQLIPAQALTPELTAALTDRILISRDETSHTVVSVPVLLRDELLGALSFHLPRGTVLNERQRDLIANVVERLAVALENRRLLQQSLTQAATETRVNQMASVLFSTTDLQTLLNLAAEQFTEVLGAINTHVTLDAVSLRETL